MKKLNKSVLALLAALIALSCSVSVFAEDIGTFEDGIIASDRFYSQYSPLFEFEAEFPNGDFEQGFKYWASDAGGAVSSVAKLKEENGNHFIELDPKEPWSAVTTVRFTLPGLKAGESYGLLYDWRCEDDTPFSVSLRSWSVDKDTLQGSGARIGYNRGALLKKAENGGFNTSMATYNHEVPSKLRENDLDTVYMSFSLELVADKKGVVQFDNLRLVRYDPETRNILSLDGEILYADVKNAGGSLSAMPNTEEKETTALYDSFPTLSFKKKLLYFVQDNAVTLAVTGSAVIVAAAVIVIVLKKVKKRKAKATQTESDEE